MDRLFDAFFGAADREQSRRWVPPVDLVEAEDHFVLKADLPGLSEADVAIEVQDGTLTISGERSAEHESHERGWSRIGTASHSPASREGGPPNAPYARQRGPTPGVRARA